MDGAAKCRAERLSAEPVLWRLTLWPRVRTHSTRRRDLRRCEGIDARGVDAHWSCLQQVHLLPRAPFAPQRRAVAALAAIQRLCGFGPATHSCKLTPVGRAADILHCVSPKGASATSSLVPSRFNSAQIHCGEGIAVTSYVPFFRLLLKKAVAQLPNDLFHYFAS